MATHINSNNNQNNRQPAPILPPTTPNTQNVRPPSLQTVNNQTPNTSNNTPTSESRMIPPTLPRSQMMTPARDMREGSAASSAGGSVRKPRQNLEERDHILMLKHCYEQRGNFKEGTRAQFWTGVNTAFQNDTGKILAQMSATVGRLVESRRRQIADWESGQIAQKPGGELNDRLDEWIEFLKAEDGDAEAERQRQVDARRKVEEARKDARRQAIAAEQQIAAQNPGMQIMTTPTAEMGQYQQQQQQPGQEVNGDMNGLRPAKRRRTTQNNDREIMEQQRIQQEQQWAYLQAHPPEPPKRVVVEGAMTKEDWREVMGNDARLRALEGKVDRIELLVSQNNKLLLQLMSNQSKDRQDREEERVPVHLDAEFERDYL